MATSAATSGGIVGKRLAAEGGSPSSSLSANHQCPPKTREEWLRCPTVHARSRLAERRPPCGPTSTSSYTDSPADKVESIRQSESFPKTCVSEEEGGRYVMHRNKRSPPMHVMELRARARHHDTIPSKPHIDPNAGLKLAAIPPGGAGLRVLKVRLNLRWRASAHDVVVQLLSVLGPLHSRIPSTCPVSR